MTHPSRRLLSVLACVAVCLLAADGAKKAAERKYEGQGRGSAVFPLNATVAPFMNLANYDAALDTHVVTVTLFYTTNPDHECKICDAFGTEMKQVIAAMSPQVKFWQVDCDDVNGLELAKGMRVQGLPWIHLYPHEYSWDKASKSYTKAKQSYQGALQAQYVQQWIGSFMTSRHIENITSTQQMDAALDVLTKDNYYKIIWFMDTYDAEPPYDFVALSHAFRYRAQFLVVPAGFTEVDARFNVTQRPALIASRPGGELYESYEGHLDFASGSDFIEFFSLRTEVRKDVRAFFRNSTNKMLAELAAEEAAKKKGRKVVNPPSNAKFLSLCGHLEGICAMLFVSRDAPNRKALLTALFETTKVVARNLNMKFVPVVVEAEANTGLMRFFDVAGPGAPCIVYLHGTQGKHFTYLGPGWEWYQIVKGFEARVTAPWEAVDVSELPAYNPPTQK